MRGAKENHENDIPSDIQDDIPSDTQSTISLEKQDPPVLVKPQEKPQKIGRKNHKKSAEKI